MNTKIDIKELGFAFLFLIFVRSGINILTIANKR